MMTFKGCALCVLFLLAGCASHRTELPTVLTSRDQQWTIPAGVTFKAIQKPAYPELTEFVVPDVPLSVIHKGSLLDLEREANKRAVRASRAGKRQGAWLGVVGSILTLLGGVFVKKKVDKKGV